MNTAPHYDVLIIGAGLSGVGAGHRLKVSSPWANFAIFEARDAIGGTWDLFRYPGIRSDSDMFTFGYGLRPWNKEDAIGQGADIRQYIEDTARESGVDHHIHFGHKVRTADWSTDEGRWTVTIEQVHTGDIITATADFVHSCAGYYRYDRGYTPDFAGMDDFTGQTIHPQLWPEDLDYADKRIVIIGSGATAVTLLPNLAKEAASVTMLQRTPSYVMAMPGKSPLQGLARAVPGSLRGKVNRATYAMVSRGLYKASRRWPKQVRSQLKAMASRMLPEGFDVETHFNPPYDPWDQRLCLTPDGDFFEAIRHGKADVVTDKIDTFTPAGLRLESGKELEADIIITATGLEMLFVGGMDITVDGEQVDVNNRLIYRAAMLEGVPNFAYVFGYTNASWTLRADLTNQYVSDLINEMRRRDMAQAMPVNHDPSARSEDENLLGLTSGYVTRAADLLPKQGTRRPWSLGQDWWSDRKELKETPIASEGMEFSNPRAKLRSKQMVAG